MQILWLDLDRCARLFRRCRIVHIERFSLIGPAADVPGWLLGGRLCPTHCVASSLSAGKIPGIPVDSRSCDRRKSVQKGIARRVTCPLQGQGKCPQNLQIMYLGGRLGPRQPFAFVDIGVECQNSEVIPMEQPMSTYVNRPICRLPSHVTRKCRTHVAAWYRGTRAC